MFTGIITHLGTFTRKKKSVYTFRVPKNFFQKIHFGTSIAINGVCLTSIKKTVNSFMVDIIPETLQRTNLGKLQENERVNMELPVSRQSLFSGHIVEGHVDGTGKIITIEKKKNSMIFSVRIPNNISRYLVQKGSIAVNGVSLTIMHAKKNIFTFAIIPHTFNHTTFKYIKTGNMVNIEINIMAKYIKQLLKK